MTDTITAGSILVEEGTHLPKSLLLRSESSSNGWAAVKDVRATFEKAIQQAGWTFFFMAGEIKTTVFGFELAGFRKRLRSRVQNSQDIILAHDDVLSAIQFDLVAGILAEQDAVTGFDVEGNYFAVVEPLALPDGHQARHR